MPDESPADPPDPEEPEEPEDPEDPEPLDPPSPSDCGSASGGIFGSAVLLAPLEGVVAPAPELRVVATEACLLSVRPGATADTRPAMPAVRAVAAAIVHPRVLRIRASAASRV